MKAGFEFLLSKNPCRRSDSTVPVRAEKYISTSHPSSRRRRTVDHGFYDEQRLSSRHRQNDDDTKDDRKMISSSETQLGFKDKPATPSASDLLSKYKMNVVTGEDGGLWEYVVKKRDIRLIPLLKLPIVFIAVIVILWSLTYLPPVYGVGAVFIIFLGAYVQAWNTVVEEKLIVTRTLGLQIQQRNILGRIKFAKFVPIENIKAVVINEIIRRQRVISYLLIVLEATESTGKIMVPLLIGTLPRLITIEKIYEQIQKVIFKIT